MARFLSAGGADVCAVAASTAASAQQAAQTLSRDLGYPVESVSSVESLFRDARVDAVAICSPAVLHRQHLELALAAGVHAFCEKPLLWTGDGNDSARAAALQNEFRARKLTLRHNEPWTFVLHDLAELWGWDALRNACRFRMELCPPEPGISMYWEAMPHPASVMAALGATGRLLDGHAEWSDSGRHLVIDLRAERAAGQSLQARIVLRHMATQPRPAALTFDDRRVEREILAMDGYQLQLRTADRVQRIRDPLERSVQAFLSRLGAEGDDDSASSDLTLRTVRLLDEAWPWVTSAGEVDGERHSQLLEEAQTPTPRGRC